MRSEELHRRARAFIDASPLSGHPDFDALACDLARFQAETIPGYSRLCAARGVNPKELTRAIDIPAVPTDAFKLTRVATFPEEEAVATFQTSGTTIGARGTHAMRDVSTYEKAAVTFGREWLARDFGGERVPVVVLAPPGMKDSSLSHMCELFVRELGEEASAEQTWLIDKDDVFDLSAFDERVSMALTRNQPMLVLATSFALVHLLDALGEDATFRLPRGSRVMQTGGFKGKSREVEPDQLRGDLARVFGIPTSHIVAEYGMTELSSQFYEQTLFVPNAKHGVFVEPRWARLIPVDPQTLAPVADGEVGIAKIIDLMNVDSAVAILTQDQVRRRSTDTFDLLGRLKGAPPRGCSIAIDELLGRTAN